VDAPPGAALPLGRPVAGTRAYVLDKSVNPVPVGVAGELCFGGIRLARGYFRQPRLTADKFIPDPFSGVPGERLYRTGDEVRYRADGVIEFLGRIDTQVKLRGFRIELGEVEAALQAHPGVAAAAVAAHPVATGDKQLVGYVVPHPGQAPPSSAELRGYLRERLPEYMVPSVVMALDELPMSSGRKVNRRLLPVPDADELPGLADGVAPRTEVEAAIAGEWAAVLGLSTVGVEHDFFDLGGHSLLATRLMARLAQLFGMDVPLQVLFEATTVSAQAQALATLAEALPTGSEDDR
jgi:hypothetical protein